MTFQPVLHPALILLLCAPVAAIALIMLARAPKGVSSRVGHHALWALRLITVLACAAMLLRPAIPGGTAQTLTSDTDIVLVVDTTASITAEDWDGDRPRLDGVRADVQAIVDAYPGARFALITLDAAAELRLPLTTDITALVSSLDVLRPEVTSRSRGSSIGIAQPLLSRTLQSASSSSPERSRMVFYFGDGEQTAGAIPETFTPSRQYTDAGGVFGYGTDEGGRMRLTTGGVDAADPGYIQYQGQDAVSTIDEQNLRLLATQLGVDYQHRTADTAPALPAAPSTTAEYAESGTTGNLFELTWIAALVVLALLGIELARAAALLARLRRLRAPATRPAPAPGKPAPSTRRAS